jgi:hypothetical protein
VAAANALLGALPGRADGDVDDMHDDPRAMVGGSSSAAFIAHVGYWSHRYDNLHSAWPFPAIATCDGLAAAARARGVLHDWIPAPGSILLRWSSRSGRFVQASIVLDAKDVPRGEYGWAFDCRVVDGLARPSSEHAKDSAGRFGSTVMSVRASRVRCFPLAGDRFISWVDLDQRGAPTHVKKAA